MHREHIFNPLKRITVILSILLLVGIDGHPQSNTMSNKLRSYPSEVPQVIRAIEDIKSYFKQEGIPVDTKEIHGKTDQYIFIKAYPYSGIDTTDLYCFVKKGDRWEMYLKAFLWKTFRKEDVEFRIHDDFVDVICKGVVVLRLNPPK